MSAYRVPIFVAALAVIALGAPCKNAAAPGDTCGTVVDVDSTDSGEVYLLQQSLKLAKVASHIPVATPIDVEVTGGDVKFAAQTKTKDAGKGKGAGADKDAGKGATAASEPSEKATAGQGADVKLAAKSAGSVDAAVAQLGKVRSGDSSNTAGLKPGEPADKTAKSEPEPSEKATEGQGAASDSVAGKDDVVWVTPPGVSEEEYASQGAGAGTDYTVPGKDGVVWVTPPSASAVASDAVTSKDASWITPPKDVADTAAAVNQSHAVPLGWIVWALIIATCLVLVLIALVVMVYRHNKREQS